MSSKKLKYSNNADRKSAVHFDRQYTTWVIAALKRISLGFRWKRSVCAHKNGFLSGAREKQKIPRETPRCLIDGLPRRPQRTDFSHWLWREYPIRDWQNVYINIYNDGNPLVHISTRTNVWRRNPTRAITALKAQTCAKGACATIKKDKRADCENMTRPFIQKLHRSSLTSEAQYTSLVCECDPSVSNHCC